jgi:hypothetical protein
MARAPRVATPGPNKRPISETRSARAEIVVVSGSTGLGTLLAPRVLKGWDDTFGVRQRWGPKE